jgi:hypothetical protein
MTEKKKKATTSTSSPAAADKTNEPRKLPRVEAIDVADGAWALVDAGGSRWLGRAYDEPFLRWLESDDVDELPPRSLQIFPAYELEVRELVTQLGTGHALVALPHALMGVGAPVRLERESLTLLRDMQASDQELYQAIVGQSEREKTEMRAARLEMQRAAAAAAGGAPT